MFKGKKVSLIFPAYNEEENIGQAVKDFKALNLIDQILVIDNNSRDQTAVIAKRSGAKVIKETKQGYGFALRRGLKEASGDYIILCEPDGTFSAKNALKLLKNIEKYDMVTGTRTRQEFIKKGANMGFGLRWGNIILAKILQFLYQTSPLTDCGCTFRILKKELAKKILPHFTVGGSYFLAELVVLTALADGKIKEIPLCYGQRIGTSKITGSFKRTVKVGWNMAKIIFGYRIGLIKKPALN